MSCSFGVSEGIPRSCSSSCSDGRDHEYQLEPRWNALTRSPNFTLRSSDRGIRRVKPLIPVSFARLATEKMPRPIFFFFFFIYRHSRVRFIGRWTSIKWSSPLGETSRFGFALGPGGPSATRADWGSFLSLPDSQDILGWCREGEGSTTPSLIDFSMLPRG